MGNHLLATLAELETSGDLALVCATLMPDHFHWVFTLGTRLMVSQAVAKWKARTRPILAGVDLVWQVNFYEHRLRADDSVEAYAFYVFMNPYMAGVLASDEIWPWWRAGEGIHFNFTTKLRENGAPQMAWLEMPTARGEGLGIALHD